jgi:hypothetical protein
MPIGMSTMENAMPRVGQLVVQKWGRFSVGEAHQLRLLAAHQDTSVAELIRRFTLAGLRREQRREPIDSGSEPAA